MKAAKALSEGHKFSGHLIISMDGTPIFFDMRRAQTIAKTAACEVQVRGTNGRGKTKLCCHMLSCRTDAETNSDV